MEAVDGAGSGEHDGTSLLDLNARVGNVEHDLLVVALALAERRLPGVGGLHDELVEGTLGNTDRTHAVVDTARAETTLEHLEATALAENNVLDRHPDVLKDHLRMSVGFVEVAKHRKVADDLDPGGVGGNKHHGLLDMAVRVLGVGLADENVELVARVGGARNPPLVAVDHVFVADALDAGLDVGGVRRSLMKRGQ